MKKLLILSLSLSFAYTSFSQQFSKIKECAIQNGILKDVELDYNPATGDRSIVVNGVRKNFYDVYPKSGPEYAKGQSWYTNSDSIQFNGSSFKKYGYPRILGINDITKIGNYKGVGVYKEVGVTGIVQVIYIPAEQGCEFQPYEIRCAGKVKIEKVSSTATSMQFTAKTTGLTGNITYEWTSKDVSIINGQGTPNVILDLTYANNDDKIYLSVVAADSRKCPISGFEGIYVSKPGAATNTGSKSNWTPKERKEFVDACIPNTKMTEANGRAYCSCMLEKIEKKYPDPATLEREFKKEDVEPWAKECRPNSQ